MLIANREFVVADFYCANEKYLVAVDVLHDADDRDAVSSGDGQRTIALERERTHVRVNRPWPGGRRQGTV